MAGDGKFTITVKIGSLLFNPSVLRSEEEVYRKAAEHINSKIDNWRKCAPKFTEAQNLSIVALELAVELMKSREGYGELVSELSKLDDFLASAE